MAWSIVGVGTSVEVTATAHALTVPAGVAQGDLLVACIASRIASTTSITLPTGGEWTLVSEQKTNNILTTGSAVASGMMAYCVRGASNPNLTFTHPAAPAPALGRIVAYRGGARPTASANDTQTSVTTAVSTTAVNVAGMTTTVADTLLVAMMAGGQEAAWSVFKSANTPSTASGTTDTTTAPSTTTWIERADVQTTTSNDTSLGIFDAVKSAAGATGNFTTTASVAASHVLVAGAFKIAVSVSTTVTGQALTTSVGTATGSIPVTATVSGQQITASVDTATVTAIQNASSAVTGQEVAASVGAVSAIVPFTGQRSYIIGSSLGGAYVSETGSNSHAIPAGYVTETYGAAGVSVSVAITGQQVTTAVGDAAVTAIQKATVDVTGQSAAVSVGDVTVSAVIGAAVSVTGQELTASAGTVTVTANRTALVDVTGQELTASAGTVTVTANRTALVDVTGQALTASVGTAAVDTGAALTVTSREYIVGGVLGATFVSETGERSYATSAGYVTETTTDAAIAGTVGVWDGTSWVQKPAKVWTGSAWVQKPVKTWNGTSWAA